MTRSAYRFLLRLLPSSFRREYGEEMTALFLRRLADRRGLPGRSLLWLDALGDVVGTSLREHGDLLARDLKIAARGFLRRPSLPLLVVATLGLGIGATTAAFSLVDHVLLRPLPFAEPDRLVQIRERAPAFGYDDVEVSPANYRDWVEGTRTFAELAAYQIDERNVTGGRIPERLEVSVASGSLFRLLGVRAALGRTLAPGDDPSGAPDVAVLSHGLWQRRFGGRRNVLGEVVDLDGRPHRIVGVAPPRFRFPRPGVALWVPLRFDEAGWADRANHYLHVIGRLAEGVDLPSARADLDRLSAILAREHPETNAGSGVHVRPLAEVLVGRSRQALILLCLAAAGVLAIGCANLANLLLARASHRRAELALRTALGAGGGRLVRQMMTESLLLAILGGSVGIAVAFLGVPVLGHLVPDSLPVAGPPSVDGRALAFGSILSLAAVVLFGLHPARFAARTSPASALRDGGRGGLGASGSRTRSALVVAQVAVSVALLISTGLLLRALASLGRIEPGFRTESVLTARTVLPDVRYPERADRQRFYDEVLRRVRALPAVESAGYTGFLPLVMPGIVWPIGADGDPGAGVPPIPSAVFREVTLGYLETLEVPLRDGRLFGLEDGPGAPLRAVISESFAEELWPGVDPVGRSFRFQWPWLESWRWTVIGVVADLRARHLEREPIPQVWVLHDQIDGLSVHAPRDLAVAVDGPPDAVADDLRRIVGEIDPEQPISDVRTMASIVAEQTVDRRVQARLLALLAGLCLAMAGLGIYGVLTVLVSRRRREIGVRLALGARPRDLWARIVWGGLRLCLVGLVPGVVGGLALGRFLRSLLAGVPPADPGVLGAVVLLCLGVGVLAAAIPGRRAVRLDPARILRSG